MPADPWRTRAGRSLRDLNAAFKRNEGILAALTAMGAIAGGLGLILAAAQLSDGRQAQDAQAYAEISRGWHEHLALFLEHPELRPYFFDGRDLPDDSDTIRRIDALADLRLDAMDHVLTAARLAGWNREDLAPWYRVFGRAFAESPRLCATFSGVAGDYPDLAKVAPKRCQARADR